MPSPQPTTNQLANAARINYRLPSLEPAVSVLARRVLNASNAVMIDPDGLVINGNWTFTGNFTPTPAAAFPGMYALGLSPEVSNVAGYAVGLVVSYTLNKHFTFKFHCSVFRVPCSVFRVRCSRFRVPCSVLVELQTFQTSNISNSSNTLLSFLHQ